MAIRFLCPNGHQLNAPENLVGKTGRCPKCNTPFVVPSPEPEVEATVHAPAEPATQPAAAPELVAPRSGAFTPSPAIQEGVGDGGSGIFVFLCPNGHKLNGPPTLKGKAGQCPHCGAKFRIPSDDDIEEPVEASIEPETAAPARDSGSNFFLAGLEQQAAAGEYSSEEQAPQEQYPQPPPAEVHALSYIVGRLWETRGENTELEIYLGEGEILSPDYYAEIYSGREFGVFASRDGETNYSVSVIPWTAVRKVSIRKLDQLPDNLFS